MATQSPTLPILTPNWEYDERRMEREAEQGEVREGPVRNISLKELVKMPEHRVLGTISNFSKEVAQDGWDLLKMVSGKGEYAPTPKESPAEKPKEEEEKKDQPLTIEQIQSWFARINSAEANEAYQNKAKDVFRITGGEPLTQDETEGYLDKDAIATAIGVAKKRVEVKVVYEDRKEAAEAQSINPAAPGENDLINGEGGGGAFAKAGDANIG